MHQHLVADEVAVGVVDPLEVVEVEHQEAERLAVTLRKGDRILELRHQRRVVQNPGEAVAVHQFADPSATLRAREDQLQQVAPLDRLREEVVATGAQPFHLIGE